MTQKPGLDFSFSGLKTAALNAWNSTEKSSTDQQDLAASFEHAIVETLVIKCKRALEATGFCRLVVAGGVSANRALRASLQASIPEVFFPRQDLCTDNAAMIAFAGFHLYHKEKPAGLPIEVFARRELER